MIRRWPVGVVATLLALAVEGAATSADGGARCWGRLVSKDFGFLTCGDRLLVRRDGAWRSTTPRDLFGPIHDAAFLDPRRGWIVTNECAAGEARVYWTRNGGRTWGVRAVSATNCAAGSRLDIFVLDSRRAWLTAIDENGHPPARLTRTDDGGITWTAVRTGIPVFGSAVFRTPNDGWVGRSDFALPHRLYVTADGGRTWRRRVLRLPPGWEGARAFPDVPTFFGSRGVLPVDLVGHGGAAVAFYETGNAGRTWRLTALRRATLPVVVPGNPFVRYVPTSVASPSEWWLLSDLSPPTVQVTSDGGRRWRSFRAPGTQAGSAPTISAVDGRRAWIVGARVLATDDGGRSWREIRA